MEIITSRHNKKLSSLLSLYEKKSRDKSRKFIIDGRKLYIEALQNNAGISDIICSESYYHEYSKELVKEPIVITDELFLSVSNEKAPQGIITAVDFLENVSNEFSCDDFDNKQIFVCDNVQDPGNLGTIIRTAYAFGNSRLVLSGNCADLYNPKTLRASMGNIFKLPLFICDSIEDIIPDLKKSHRVFAAALHKDSVQLSDLKINKSDCFIVGNEGHGLSDRVIELCDGTVFIPMEKDAESLNVSQAATVLLWEMKKARETD